MQIDYYDFISKHYSLKKLNCDITKNKFILLLYDDKYYYYLNDCEFISLNEIDDILTFIKDLSAKFSIKVSNYYPVCYCKKSLVIALRIDSSTSTLLNRLKYEELDKKYKLLCKYHSDYFSTIFVSSNVEKEISMSKKYINRYKFHEKFIKRYLLTEKKRKKEEFRELLRELIPNKKSIIDVSCGDNSDIFEIAKDKGYKTIVGNDICLNYLNTHSNNSIVFTNDNIEDNNIKNRSYDVSYVKNTLHHMNNIVCINNLLDTLNNISNEIIIVEILNPVQTGGLPKFLNKYLYSKFLKDVGRCYLNELQFQTIINNKFENKKIKYYKFNNILGEYMIAKIN